MLQDRSTFTRALSGLSANKAADNKLPPKPA